jgi:uncharacterized protein (DUF4415 family)
MKDNTMKKEYDFKEGKRGSVIKTPKGKTRITIRIDDDILDWFRQQVHKAGGGSYQTLINIALREYMNLKRESLEETLRHVIREECLTMFLFLVIQRSAYLEKENWILFLYEIAALRSQ